MVGGSESGVRELAVFYCDLGLDTLFLQFLSPLGWNVLNFSQVFPVLRRIKQEKTLTVELFVFRFHH